VNFVPIDLVLDYMILGYLRAERFYRIFLYLNELRSFQAYLSIETKEVARTNLRVMIKLA
jgi:hypothetical protein